MTVRSKGISSIYKKHLLANLLAQSEKISNDESGHRKFSAFQRDVIESAFPNFAYQFCATSTITTDEKGFPIELNSICLNLPGDIIESYQRHAQHDDLSPLCYANPGRVINYTEVCADKDIGKHPFFIKHCMPYGIYKAASIGFLHPAHHSTFITFDYMGDKHNKNWNKFNFSKLELASFPFALAWLFRFGKIDKTELQRCYRVIEDFTHSQLVKFQKYINSPSESLTQQAETLGIKPGTLKDELYKIRDETMIRFDSPDSQLPSDRKSLRVLDAHASFMRMLGDPTTPLKKF